MDTDKLMEVLGDLIRVNESREWMSFKLLAGEEDIPLLGSLLVKAYCQYLSVQKGTPIDVMVAKK